MPCNASYTRFIFLEGFSYVLQIDMHFICTPMWTKFYSCKKWVLQGGTPELGLVAAPGHGSLPDVAQRGEGCTGSPPRASPGRWW
jgi:hypothetical protein